MFIRHNNHEEEHNFWMSYTDLMSGFLIVFIIISVVMYVNYQKEIRQNKELNEAIKEAKLDKDELDRLLTEYKKNDLRNVIDEYKGTIRPTESIDVDFSKDRGSIIITSKYGELFAAGEPKGDYLTVPDELERFLDLYGKQIVEKTMEICANRQRPVELRIEGHTDPTWSGYDRGSDGSFMENLKLSSKRANAVYQYILYSTGLSEEQRSFVRQNMISVGYSFSSRIINNDVDNQYEDDKSRRIEFRIIAK